MTVGKNATDIIISKGAKPSVPQKVIRCSTGDARLHCNNCMGMQFAIHVTPALTGENAGGARVNEIICTTCGKLAKPNPAGYIP